MKPVLSIIVPVHNGKSTLPQLLESIAAQNLPVETIVVDDCSEDSCESLVQSFRGPTQDTLYIRLPKQVFTKEARLIGLEAARAEIITFADMDDTIYGTDNLAAAVDLFHHHNPDILHCSSINTAEAHIQEWVWAAPVAAELVHWDIIQTFTSQFRAWNIWGKLYRRSLWLRLIPEARSFPVRRFCEDMYLFLLYALHANHYIGAPIPVYGYHWIPDTTIPRTLGRLLALQVIRRDFIPYMRKIDCPKSIEAALDGKLAGRIALLMMHCLQDFSLLRNLENSAMKNAALSQALTEISPRELLHILLESNAIFVRTLAECSQFTSRLA